MRGRISCRCWRPRHYCTVCWFFVFVASGFVIPAGNLPDTRSSDAPKKARLPFYPLKGPRSAPLCTFFSFFFFFRRSRNFFCHPDGICPLYESTPLERTDPVRMTNIEYARTHLPRLCLLTKRPQRAMSASLGLPPPSRGFGMSSDQAPAARDVLKKKNPYFCTKISLT